MHPDRVKDLSIALVDIEPVIQELAEETAGLRDAKDVRRAAPNVKVGPVPECRRRVANRGQPHTCDEWTRRAVRHTVPPARVKSAVQLQFGDAVRIDHEPPALARNGDRIVPEEIADGKAIRR